MVEDYLSIAQSNTDIELADTSNPDISLPLDFDAQLLAIKDVTCQEGFEYPAILLSNVKFKDCINVLQSLCKNSWRSLDIWIDLEDGTVPVKMGKLPLNSDMLCVARYLNIVVTIYLSETDVETLNLQNPEILMRYV